MKLGKFLKDIVVNKFVKVILNPIKEAVRKPEEIAKSAKPEIIRVDTDRVLDVDTGELIENPIYDEYFPEYTQIVLDNFKSYLAGFPEPIYEPYKKALNALIDQYGEDAVAKAIDSLPDGARTYLDYIKHGNYEKGAIEMSSNILNMMPISEQEKQEMEDKITSLVWYED